MIINAQIPQVAQSFILSLHATTNFHKFVVACRNMQKAQTKHVLTALGAQTDNQAAAAKPLSFMLP